MTHSSVTTVDGRIPNNLSSRSNALLNRDHDTFLERSHKGVIRGAILHNWLLLGKHVQGRRGERPAFFPSFFRVPAHAHTRSKFPPTN